MPSLLVIQFFPDFNMKFTFINKSSCCGGGTQVLQSTGYAVDATNPGNSLIQALDRFHVNYRVTPTGVVLSDEELGIMQHGLSSTAFSLINGILHLHKMPVTIVQPIV
jgi:hypothetical protein